MILIVFAIYVTVFIVAQIRSPREIKPMPYGLGAGIMIFLSTLAFAQESSKTLKFLAVVFVLIFIFDYLKTRVRFLHHPLFPLTFAASLITLHNVLHLKVLGASYLLMSTARDLRERSLGQIPLKQHVLNLVNFPKSLVGPITRSQDHEMVDAATMQKHAYKLAVFGITKCFLLANAWLQYTPQLKLRELGPFFENFDQYMMFALSKYVYVYLEFSGSCDLVAAIFLTLGFNCPLNFRTPYWSLTISEFWTRWHVTLGVWIRNHIYIPLGGNRISPGRTYFNLYVCMILSGIWHAPTWNFVVWGLVQGTCMSVERMVGLDRKIQFAPRTVKVLSWFYTQSVVTVCWLLFFA